MQRILSGGEYLDILEKVDRLISLCISNRNRILKTHKTDCVSIAEIEQKSNVFATTTCCGVRDPRILETIIDFVTLVTQPEWNLWTRSNHLVSLRQICEGLKS